MKKCLISTLFTVCAFANFEDSFISTQEIKLQQPNHMEGWLDNIDVAKELAKEKNRPLLIAFLGPNWCAPSDQFESEVLTTNQFISEMKDQVILAKVDIEEDFEERPLGYPIESCPSVLLVTQSGQLISKLNLTKSSKLFAKNIKELISDQKTLTPLNEKKLKLLKGAELESIYAKAGKLADATLKNVVLAQGLKRDKSPYFLLEKYSQILASGKKSPKLKKLRSQIFARDPQNQRGYLRKLALIDFASLCKQGKVETATHPLTEYLKKFGNADRENAWRLEMKISQFLYSKDKLQGALKHAKNSLELAPEESKKEITQSIEYLNERCTSRSQ